MGDDYDESSICTEEGEDFESLGECEGKAETKENEKCELTAKAMFEANGPVTHFERLPTDIFRELIKYFGVRTDTTPWRAGACFFWKEVRPFNYIRLPFPESDCCSWAAINGHQAQVKWYVEKGYRIPSTLFRDAGEGGNLTLLEWLEKDFRILIEKRIGEAAGIAADSHANLIEREEKIKEMKTLLSFLDLKTRWKTLDYINTKDVRVIKWLHSRGYRFSANDTMNAIEGGHFKVAKWLIKRGAAPKDILNRTLSAGDLDFAKWIFARYETNPKEYVETNSCPVMAGGVDMLKWTKATKLAGKCFCHNIYLTRETLEWVRDQNLCKCHPKSLLCTTVASRERMIEIWEWLHERYPDSFPSTCKEVIHFKNASFIKFLREKDVPWGETFIEDQRDLRVLVTYGYDLTEREKQTLGHKLEKFMNSCRIELFAIGREKIIEEEEARDDFSRFGPLANIKREGRGYRVKFVDERDRRDAREKLAYKYDITKSTPNTFW